MLKEHAQVFRRLMMVADAFLAALAFFIGYFLRSKAEGLFPLSSYLWLLPGLVLVWVSLLYVCGMYASFRLKRASEVIYIVLKTALTGVIVLSSVNYLFRIMYISRSFVFLIFSITTALIIVEKIALMQYLRFLRRGGFNFRNIIIVGTGKRAQRFIERVAQHPEFGLKVVGLIDEDPQRKGTTVQGCCVIGTFKDLPQILHDNAVDHVVFIVPRSWLASIEEPMLYCETVGVRVSIAVDYFELRFARAKQSEIYGMPLLTFESTPDKIWHLLLKRLLDVSISVVALIVLLPLFALTSFAIKITSTGPVFFRQQRCSLNGRKFTLYKFRTMSVDAEQRLQELRRHNEMKGPAFKMKNDPRITPLGRLLRKFSIDELPQLWNVLKGDMSLVGPRPPLPREVDVYDHWQRRRLSMRPGITCLWQIQGRNRITDFDEWMRLDLEYIDKWSLWLDFRILCSTIPVVLLGVGAR